MGPRSRCRSAAQCSARAEAARLRLALDVDGELALAVAQRGLQRVHDPLALAGLDPKPVEHHAQHAALGVEPGVLDAHRHAALEHAPEARLLERLAHDTRGDLPADAVREA